MQLTRVPLSLSVVWHGKTVATDQPRYPKHREWWLDVIATAPSPVCIASFLDQRGSVSWSLMPGPAATENRLTANFFPHDWVGSDTVQIAFGGQRLTVSDDSLKRDPRSSVHVAVPSVAETGVLIEIAKIGTLGITLSILAVAEQDTERRRLDRWRIKPLFQASLPAMVVPLTSGHQSGARDE